MQQRAIRAADRQNRIEVKPLDPQWARKALADMRALLEQEVPMAAEAIRTLTGPIRIRQEVIPGKRGARWFATFSPDLTALLRKLATDKGASDRAVLAVMPTAAETMEVVIDALPHYERLAPKFKELHEQGANAKELAKAYGISVPYARGILKFAMTRKRPTWVTAN